MAQIGTLLFHVNVCINIKFTFYTFSHLKRSFSQIHYEVGEMRTPHK